MSVGGAIGGIVGGVVGWFIGGPTGALYGASIGMSLGMLVDPITPDIPAPGTPLPMAGQAMSTEVGGPLPDLVGTAKIVGHLLCFGKERTETVMTQPESSGGKGSGDDPDPYVSGYKYYMSWAVGIVAGPVDTIYTIYKNDDVVWEGALDIPASGGQETIVLGGEIGSAIFYFGTTDQVANASVGEIIGDSTLNSPYRHFCWCFFDDCYIGQYNRCPTMKFMIRKAPVIAFSAGNEIQTFDYNPIHAIWYTLHDLAGLPESWLHTADFAVAASTMSVERRGISCLFDRQQNALNYLEAFNSHIDGIIRYGSDGKFHPKLIREDYVVGDLPLIDEDKMLDDPTLNRKSWIDTVNEVKVQYSELFRPGTANIFNLFRAGGSRVVGFHFNGFVLSLIGSYASVDGARGLALRQGDLVVMDGDGITAKLQRIGTSAVGENLPLLASYPITNQYDVLNSGYSSLVHNPLNDKLFYVDSLMRVIKFGGLAREARGFYNTVTTGTDGNLYVRSARGDTWNCQPIIDPLWGSFWDLIPDNICDSHVVSWGSETLHPQVPSSADCVFSSSSLYVVLYASPTSYLRKLNQSSFDIEISVAVDPNHCMRVTMKGNRVFTLNGVVGSCTVCAYDAGDLSSLGNSVALSGTPGDIEVVENYIIVITSTYGGGDSGIYKLDPIFLNVVDFRTFSPGEDLLYQTLTKIDSIHVAAGRNNGLSVFNTATLARTADISLPIEFSCWSSRDTVVV